MPKPKDFTESAVKLVNPPEVKELLEKLSDEQVALDRLELLIKESNSEVYDRILEQRIKLADLQTAIREAIEEHGSYQSLDDERYGVKYARKTAIYGNLASFKKNFPKFVELCIKETIDVSALKGQVKGKLITEEELERTKVLTWDTGYSFYVR